MTHEVGVRLRHSRNCYGPRSLAGRGWYAHTRQPATFAPTRGGVCPCLMLDVV